MAPPPKRYCQRGHDMSITRKRNRNGVTFCNECKKIQRKQQARNPKAKLKRIKYSRQYQLKSRYGLSLSEYESILEKQGHVCRICGIAWKPECKLHVDHIHNSKIVRGLLCSKCNMGLGLFQENPILLANAISYISQTNDFSLSV